MRILKYLIAVWTTIAIYTVSAYLVGPTGILALKQLSVERDKQQSNIEALKELNQELEGTMNALKYDSDTIMVYARELGYGTGPEHFVRIVGLGGTRKQRATAGQITVPRAPNAIPDRILWFIAICTGAALLVLLSITEFIQERRIRWRYYK
ncbi:putative septum formation initiator subfamily [Treponema primitia ZAS-2]|uniref:Putative septum formation initiator subfamily n=1 Tax=Treponema primitia (strain ATCC BAA-887 / DSM 12427 / ZAS-2) TaxID=545694 RepID=F5YH13_TREPZ|nr:septum formation initiator family protein [Treponema primitia]AEF85003.1 putative septum formation initiator subfamily [Treponema primitia ZAS-2]